MEFGIHKPKGKSMTRVKEVHKKCTFTILSAIRGLNDDEAIEIRSQIAISLVNA